MKIIIINATAARYSGALTILKNFMSFVYVQNDSHYFIHLLTTTEDVFHNAQNVLVHEIAPQNWRMRLSWDRNGFQRWCESDGILPDVVISFQNTCPRLTGALRAVKLLVYYHQPLPLVKYQWKWHRSDERILFLYAHFYGLFVNRWNKNAEYVVQLPFVKELFCKKFPNIPSARVHVIRPNLPYIGTDSVLPAKKVDGKYLFVFPATPLRYKNHIVILNALHHLRFEDPEILENMYVVFTVPSDSIVAETVVKLGLNDVVRCIGSIPYEELLSLYKVCDTLLFPSKIESFGLPLVEAAMFGVPIVAADLPYAREVLEDYDGATFAASDDYKAWGEKIKCIVENERQKHTPFSQSKRNSWADFTDLMMSL